MLTKDQAAKLRETLKDLYARSPADIRKLAIAQRDAVAAKLADKRTIEPLRWAWWDKALEDIQESLRKGDALSGQTSEQAIKEQRTLYIAAWRSARDASETLDQEINFGTSALVDVVTFFGETAQTVANKAGKAVDAVGKAAEGVGGTAKTVAIIVGVGAGVGLVAYAITRGRQARARSANRPSYA